MGQKTLPSHSSLKESGREAEQHQLPEPIKTVGPHTEPFAPGRPGCPKSDSGDSQVWLGAILCSFFLHRWFNLPDPGVADVSLASPMLHRFARVGWGRAGVLRKTSTCRSRHPVEQSGFLEPAPHTAQPGGQPQVSFSWKMSGLLLTVFLLAWLLLL